MASHQPLKTYGDAARAQARWALAPTLSAVSLLALGLAGAWSASAADADILRRCEDAYGHVTYSNQNCPAGTAHERKVDKRPAVEVPPQIAGAKTSPSAPAGAPFPSSAEREPRSPEDMQEMAQEKRKSLIARCDDLVRRIEYAQQDLQSAAPGGRSSAELALRRIQEEHASLCAPPQPATPIP